jgi:hypothetical protein
MKPNLEELKTIREFAYLAENSAVGTMNNQRGEKGVGPICCHHTWEMWSEGYHRAFYRLLAAGPILSRAYFVPFVSKTKPRGFLKSFLQTRNGWSGGESWFPSTDRAYIQSHPLYDIEKHQRWESFFRPLEDLYESRGEQEAGLAWSCQGLSSTRWHRWYNICYLRITTHRSSVVGCEALRNTVRSDTPVHLHGGEPSLVPNGSSQHPIDTLVVVVSFSHRIPFFRSKTTIGPMRRDE